MDKKYPILKFIPILGFTIELIQQGNETNLFGDSWLKGIRLIN